MSSKQNPESQEALKINEETIAEYLHQNPEFFEHNPDILTELTIRHQVNGAVSLIERQISTLREQNKSLKEQLDSLVKIARDNDKLNERMHRLTLALMDANNLNEVYIALDDSLRGDFEADAVTVKLFIDPAKADLDPDNDLIQTIFVPMDDPRLDSFKHILGHEKPVCGSLKLEQLEYLFGEQADQIKSTAMIPLGGEKCSPSDCNYIGVLAIGSHDEERFHASIGTLFLSNLGDILSRGITPYVADKDTDE